MTHKCEFPDCDQPGSIDCYLPGDSEPHFYCADHVFDAGFCIGCNQFWGGVESFDFGDGFCPNCRDEFDDDDWDDDDNDYAYWDYPVGWYMPGSDLHELEGDDTATHRYIGEGSESAGEDE